MYKHKLLFSKAFKRITRKLEGKSREILMKRLEEIANNPERAGKELKGPLKGIRATRLNKHYRIFYKIPEKCQVYLINIYLKKLLTKRIIRKY